MDVNYRSLCWIGRNLLCGQVHAYSQSGVDYEGLYLVAELLSEYGIPGAGDPNVVEKRSDNENVHKKAPKAYR